MADERRKGPDRLYKPPDGGSPVEEPFYEERFELDSEQREQQDSADRDITGEARDDGERGLSDSDNDWYWQEPDDVYPEEDMWPWPEQPPRPKRA